MATPATSVGYSISIGNGATCVTGWTRTSKVSKNTAARRWMSAASACARATSSSVSARPSSMFQTTVSFIRLRCCASSGPYSAAKLCARRVKKTSRAPVRSG